MQAHGSSSKPSHNRAAEQQAAPTRPTHSRVCEAEGKV
jgi:hypothetical protein